VANHPLHTHALPTSGPAAKLQSCYRTMLCVSMVFAVAWCPSICLSLTFVHSIQMVEDIVKLLCWPDVAGPPLLSGRCTSLLRAPVSEMTYTVSNGTLNSTIPYHTEISRSRYFSTLNISERT